MDTSPPPEDQHPPDQPESPGPEHPPSEQHEPEKPSKPYHSGNGKIARLPEKTRDQINQMLADGVPHLQILESIGEYAKGITVGNITTWKTHGGFQRWLDHRDTKAALNITRTEAADLATEKPAAPLQEASRSLASAQIYDLLRLFDTTALRSALASKPELYLQLISSISRLSEAEAACAHRQIQQALAQLKLEQAKAIDSAIDPKKMYTGTQMLEILRHIKIL
jgi:hypothetical protein